MSRFRGQTSYIHSYQFLVGKVTGKPIYHGEYVLYNKRLTLIALRRSYCNARKSLTNSAFPCRFDASIFKARGERMSNWSSYSQEI